MAPQGVIRYAAAESRKGKGAFSGWISPWAATAVNRPGFGHLAAGEVVTVAVAGGGQVTWRQATDPEGDMLERPL